MAVSREQLLTFCHFSSQGGKEGAGEVKDGQV